MRHTRSMLLCPCFQAAWLLQPRLPQHREGQHSSISRKIRDLAGCGPVWSLLLRQLCDYTYGRHCASLLSTLASCLAEGPPLPRVSYLSLQDLKGAPRQPRLELRILKACPWKTLSSRGTWASAGSALVGKQIILIHRRRLPTTPAIKRMAGK